MGARWGVPAVALVAFPWGVFAWWLYKRSFVVPYPPHRLRKSAFFGRFLPWLCVRSVLGLSWRFGAVLGLVWAVRPSIPQG